MREDLDLARKRESTKTTAISLQLTTTPYQQSFASMKFVQYIYVLLAASSAVAFQPVVVVRSRKAMMQLAMSADEDAEKLEAMSKTWDELRKKEKEVGRSHDEVNRSL